MSMLIGHDPVEAVVWKRQLGGVGTLIGRGGVRLLGGREQAWGDVGGHDLMAKVSQLTCDASLT